MHAITLIKLRAHPEAIAIRRIPPEFSDCVADFLMRYRWRPALFKAAVNFLQCTNYMPFLLGSFFPPDVEYVTDMEYDEAWRRMIAALEPHDLILTFDRTSSLSKIIALCTHGPFSHVATYVGEGKIWEIVTSGARVVPIEHYKDRHKYRVAAYRHFGHEPMTRDEQLADMMSVVGNVRYGYLGALWGGIKSYFGYHERISNSERINPERPTNIYCPSLTGPSGDGSLAGRYPGHDRVISPEVVSVTSPGLRSFPRNRESGASLKDQSFLLSVRRLAGTKRKLRRFNPTR